MLVFKLGLAKLQCRLLMNGLVFDSNEVLLKFLIKKKINSACLLAWHYLFVITLNRRLF